MIEVTREQMMELPIDSMVKCICSDKDIILMRKILPMVFKTVAFNHYDEEWSVWSRDGVELSHFEYGLTASRDLTWKYYIPDCFKSKQEINDTLKKYLEPEREELVSSDTWQRLTVNGTSESIVTLSTPASSDTSMTEALRGTVLYDMYLDDYARGSGD